MSNIDNVHSVRELHVNEIESCVAKLCVQANIVLPEPVRGWVRGACEREPYATAREFFTLMEHNTRIAEQERIPICQDTGMAVVYADIGQDVHLVGGTLEDAVNAGVRRGYGEGYLRKSVVSDPIRRVNTGDNTPAVLHTRLVEGHRVRLAVVPKGFGSENMSRLKMLTPADGMDGVRAFVVETARLAGANPCPPMVLGVGVGGTFERVAGLAKEALAELREGPHPDLFYAKLEDELLEEINELASAPRDLAAARRPWQCGSKPFPRTSRVCRWR